MTIVTHQNKAFEAWHLGLPPKPDLFDFLQCQAKAAVEPRILSFNEMPNKMCIDVSELKSNRHPYAKGSNSGVDPLSTLISGHIIWLGVSQD